MRNGSTLATRLLQESNVTSCVERKAQKNCMKSDENDENLAHIVIFEFDIYIF